MVRMSSIAAGASIEGAVERQLTAVLRKAEYFHKVQVSEIVQYYSIYYYTIILLFYYDIIQYLFIAVIIITIIIIILTLQL